MAGASWLGKLSQSGDRGWWSAYDAPNARRSSHAGRAGSLSALAFLGRFTAAGRLMDDLGNIEEIRFVNALR